MSGTPIEIPIFLTAALVFAGEEGPSPPAPTEADPSAELTAALTDYLLDHDSGELLRTLDAIARTHPRAIEPRVTLARFALSVGDTTFTLAQIEELERPELESSAKHAAIELRAELERRTRESDPEVDSVQTEASTAPEPNDAANRSFDVLRIARSLREIGPRQIVESSAIPTDWTRVAVEAPASDALAEYERWMSEGIRHFESESWERAMNAFFAAQAALPDAIDPTVRLLVVTARMRSLEHAASVARLTKGRLSSVLGELFEYPESVWWIENEIALATLQEYADSEAAKWLDGAHRIFVLHRAIQSVGSFDVKGAYLARLGSSISTLELKKFERHLRSAP